MSNIKTTEKHFKERDIQTRLKHDLLTNYIRNWGTVFGKAAISKNIENVHFVDCFAGRGTFLDGDPGSPKLAIDNLFSLQATFNKYRKNNCKFYIHTIELEETFNQLLKQDLKAYCQHPQQVQINEGTFRQHLPYLLNKTDGSPALYFIDPFGYKGVDMADVIKIINTPYHETLINVMSYSLVRNINIKENKRELCNFFGLSNLDNDIKEYIELSASLDNPQPKTLNLNLLKLEDKIIHLYKRQILKIANSKVYILNKRIHSQLNTNVYFHMVFVTKSRKGLVEMKDAMVKFDMGKEQTEKQYIQQKEIQQFSLYGDLFTMTNNYDFYTFETFINDLKKKFNGVSTSYGEIIDYFLLESPLPFRDLNNSKKSIYDFIKRATAEIPGLVFSKKAFADLKDADNIKVKPMIKSIEVQQSLF